MPNPMRGEVWRVDFEPVEGSEIGKERPAVVIGDETLGKLRVRVVVPITGWKEPYKEYVWMTAILPHWDTGLTKPSAADALQIRTVAVTRFTDRLGMLPMAVVDEIASSIALCVKAPRT
jgi:mRNA interferase MazF